MKISQINNNESFRANWSNTLTKEISPLVKNNIELFKEIKENLPTATIFKDNGWIKLNNNSTEHKLLKLSYNSDNDKFLNLNLSEVKKIRDSILIIAKKLFY